ncbi:MAG: class I SAM-dependent methyltransferase [Planctomycetes bacterium]|jgi:ubiquinone/menaquinone biosynthesis C-methylase UbiE|nr:class I SAM-dependent methyltransferase [Planctomycetota bacterium]
MAFSWQDAQVREKAFYDRIYRDNQGDIPSYQPFTPRRCVAFAQKTVQRFGYTLDAFGGKVLADIGCGPHGIISGLELFAAEHGAMPQRMYGIDPLMEAYKAYEEYGVLREDDVIQLLAARGEDVPLPDGSCDYVFCTNAVDHVEDPEAVIREARRICKPGGALCLSVHIVHPAWTWSGPLLWLVDRNHPHHFRAGTVLRLLRRYFERVTVCRSVRVVEDHPEFTFASILTAPHRFRAAKRWLSDVVLRSLYVRCET